MRHLTYSNVVATTALVFAMGGTALAGSHYVITSTSQIKPSVRAALHGARGLQGIPGTAAAAGTPGTPGPQGPQGPQGPAGSSASTAKLCNAIENAYIANPVAPLAECSGDARPRGWVRPS